MRFREEIQRVMEVSLIMNFGFNVLQNGPGEDAKFYWLYWQYGDMGKGIE